MNSGFKPLPQSMPFMVRAEKMVERGEAKSLSAAVKALRKPRRDYGRIAVSKMILPVRLPYSDN
jgi:hypothetical protein